MYVDKAAYNTKLLWVKKGKLLPDPERTTHGGSEAHVVFVLNSIQDGDVEGEKAHRWLGWAQGWLVARELLTLDDCKYANVFS